MPRLKPPLDKYRALKILILGNMADQGVTQEEVGGWFDCCRQTVNHKLSSPELLTLSEITTLSRRLNIPAEEMRSAIPF